MEYLLAPWREEYVRKVRRIRSCIFCRASKLRDEQTSYLLFRGKYNFVLLNKYPYTPGHLMIAPYRHTASFERVPPEVGAEMAGLLQMSLRILKKSYHPRGFNAGMNIGQSAGAGVVHHYHLHVIPRWHGDSNFMPLVSLTRVLIEDLDSTYDRLLPLFQSEARGGGRKR
jgi:ATP adenylyltransferase